MIEIFKSWIGSLLCLGIFVTFLELIMPSSKIKKYIYSLVGIVTIITIISPIINMYKNNDVESGLQQVISSISSNVQTEQVKNGEDVKKDYNNAKDKAVKDQFITSVKKDIESKLMLRGIEVTTVDIIIDDEYNISNITINIKKLSESNSTLTSVNKVVNYINEEYDIDYSKIIVIESGD